MTAATISTRAISGTARWETPSTCRCSTDSPRVSTCRDQVIAPSRGRGGYCVQVVPKFCAMMSRSAELVSPSKLKSYQLDFPLQGGRWNVLHCTTSRAFTIPSMFPSPGHEGCDLRVALSWVTREL